MEICDNFASAWSSRFNLDGFPEFLIWGYRFPVKKGKIKTIKIDIVILHLDVTGVTEVEISGESTKS
jgi:hypothetical protein